MLQSQGAGQKAMKNIATRSSAQDSRKLFQPESYEYLLMEM